MTEHSKRGLETSPLKALRPHPKISEFIKYLEIAVFKEKYYGQNFFAKAKNVECWLFL